MKITKEQFDNLPYDLKKNFIHRKIKRRPLDNIVETGAGALNIDDGRIPVDAPVTINRFTNGAKPWGDAKGEEYGTVETMQGRWPSNLLITEESAKSLNLQTGVLTSGKPSGKKKAGNNIYGKYKNEDIDVTGFGDSGGASRFFFTVEDKLDECDPVYYCGKVSQKERNAGLNDFPDVMTGMSNGAQIHGEGYDKGQDIGLNRVIPKKNPHPTLKPISLCKYLAALLLPPDEYSPRRIFVPFSGVSSEMIGAGLAGWDHVVGVEFDKENGYIDIAKKRLDYWLGDKK